MVSFQDPVTNTRYRPFKDPSGTAMKAVGIVGGVAMTALLLMIALRQLVPALDAQLSNLSGGFINAGGTAWEGF